MCIIEQRTYSCGHFEELFEDCTVSSSRIHELPDDATCAEDYWIVDKSTVSQRCMRCKRQAYHRAEASRQKREEENRNQNAERNRSIENWANEVERQRSRHQDHMNAREGFEKEARCYQEDARERESPTRERSRYKEGSCEYQSP